VDPAGLHPPLLLEFVKAVTLILLELNDLGSLLEAEVDSAAEIKI
jgi:hypothetical protein